MEALVLFGLFMFMLLIGVPIGLAIGLSVVFTIPLFTNINLMLVAQQSIVGVDSFPLMAIPFFILAGNIMSTGGVAKRLVNLANALFSFVTGGLAVVATVTSLFFAAISGSAVATTSAVGSFLVPEMKKKNYDVPFAASVVAAAGTVGVIIPPSIPLVIYAVVVGASITDLFIAGIIPGFLMGLALIIANILMSKKLGIEASGSLPKLMDVLVAFREAFWALLAPVIVLGGIYSGIFTPTEAAVVTVVYSVFVGAFIYKELTWASLYKSLYDTIVVNGVTTFMVGLSCAFAGFLSLQHIPTSLASAMLELTSNKIVILLMINVFLLIIGTFIDNIPATIILSPIFLPVVSELGVSATQLGIIITMNLAIGFITPPYGINLFVASAVSDVPMEKMVKPILWLIFSLLIVLMLVTYVPETTMFLVDLMKK
ncbi:C4-dicarboxylate ABC transporter permease [Deltaproteobacteria bacterium Smac51]|nr:C4-dicarboxylate ABC transporter permease [Deltaproteobacteria bacterium Smac51]